MIIKLNGTVANDASLPISANDELITAGTRMMFDFANPKCYAGAVAGRAPMAGETLQNLVEGGTPSDNLATNLVYTGGGFDFNAANSSPSINLGTTYGSAGGAGDSPDYLTVGWVKLPRNKNLGSGYISVFGIGAYDAAFKGRVNTREGTDNLIQFESASGFPITDVTTLPTGVLQIGMSWQKNAQGAIQRVFVNGKQLYAKQSTSKVLLNTSGLPFWVGSGIANDAYLTGYRFFMEHLGVSGVDPAEHVLLDWHLNKSRFA